MWTSIIIYRMALQYAEQYINKQEDQLPPYEEPTPQYEALSPIG